MPSRRVVVAFMAHPDDVEISCAGTLIRLKELGWKIHIATVTAGDCGTMTLSADEIAAARVKEACAAASVIGAEYHCLGEPDGRVIYNRTALQKTIDLFREISPGLVITLSLIHI